MILISRLTRIGLPASLLTSRAGSAVYSQTGGQESPATAAGQPVRVPARRLNRVATLPSLSSAHLKEVSKPPQGAASCWSTISIAKGRTDRLAHEDDRSETDRER